MLPPSPPTSWTPPALPQLPRFTFGGARAATEPAPMPLPAATQQTFQHVPDSPFGGPLGPSQLGGGPSAMQQMLLTLQNLTSMVGRLQAMIGAISLQAGGPQQLGGPSAQFGGPAQLGGPIPTFNPVQQFGHGGPTPPEPPTPHHHEHPAPAHAPDIPQLAIGTPRSGPEAIVTGKRWVTQRLAQINQLQARVSAQLSTSGHEDTAMTALIARERSDVNRISKVLKALEPTASQMSAQDVATLTSSLREAQGSGGLKYRPLADLLMGARARTVGIDTRSLFSSGSERGSVVRQFAATLDEREAALQRRRAAMSEAMSRTGSVDPQVSASINRERHAINSAKQLLAAAAAHIDKVDLECVHTLKRLTTQLKTSGTLDAASVSLVMKRTD